MSKYTTEVRFLCEKIAGLEHSVGSNDVNSIIKKAVPKIFDFDFPIFDENYRSILCGKILKHYYTREIGEETVGLWKLRLDTRLNEIMPYYNQLYKSELLEFNPLWDTDLTTKHKNDRSDSRKIGEDETNGKIAERNTVRDTNNHYSSEQTTHSEDAGATTNWDMYSDTPQGAITNVENNTYLTNARKITNDDNNTVDGTANETYNGDTTETTDEKYKEDSTRNKSTTDDLTSTEDYIQNITGKSGGSSYGKLLQEFRQTFLNIDVDIINALSDLFMCIW